MAIISNWIRKRLLIILLYLLDAGRWTLFRFQGSQCRCRSVIRETIYDLVKNGLSFLFGYRTLSSPSYRYLAYNTYRCGRMAAGESDPWQRKKLTSGTAV